MNANPINDPRSSPPKPPGPPNFDAMIASILTDKTSDRYHVGEVIARGGMGAIHSVRDCNSRRDVVMKVVLPNRRSSIPTILRFIREAQITAQLEHPNIVPVYELGLDENRNIYYTMKKVHGITLREILSRIRDGDPDTIAEYTLARLLDIFQRVGDAIAYAHSKGVVHRDLKPENIMIGAYGEVLVLDWGLAKVIGLGASANNANVSEGLCHSQFYPGSPNDPAKDAPGAFGNRVTCIDSDIESTYMATLEGRILGTPAYLSPEQASGKPSEISCQSDIYALGGILYSILTLDIPVTGMSPKAVIAKVLNGQIDSPDTYNARRGLDLFKQRKRRNSVTLYHCPGRRIPQALSAVTMKAMNLNPVGRYQTVEELQDDLANYQHGFATVAEDAGAIKLIVLLIKRNRLWAIFLLVFVLLAGGFIMQVVYSEREARRLQNLAEQGEQIARKNVFITKEAGRRAQVRFADTLIAQGNSMAQLNQWDIAKINYVEAHHVLHNLGESTYAVEIRLWEAFGKSPPLLWARRNLSRVPRSLAVSDDSRVTISGNDDGTISCWDNITGRTVALIQESQPFPPWQMVALASDRDLAATASSHGDLVLWNIASEKRLHTFDKQSGEITFLLFGADGSTLVTGSSDGSATVWDVRTLTSKLVLSGNPNAMSCAVVSGDGMVVIPNDDRGSLTGYDMESGQILTQWSGAGEMYSYLARDETSSWFAAGSDTGVIVVYSRNSREPQTILRSHKSPVVALRFMEDGSRLLSAQKDSTVTEWDISTGNTTSKFTGQFEEISAIAIAPNGRFAALHSDDGSLNLMPLSITGDVSSLTGHKGNIVDTAVSRNGLLIFSIDDESTAILWDAATGHALQHFEIGSDSRLQSIAFRGDQFDGVVATASGAVFLLNAMTGTVTNLAAAPATDAATATALSTSGRVVVSGYNDGRVIVRDTAVADDTRELVTQDYPLRHLSCGSDDSIFTAVAENGMVSIWSIDTLERVGQMEVPGAMVASHSPSRNEIIVGDRDGVVRLFGVDNLDASASVGSFKVHYREIVELRYLPMASYCLSIDLKSNMKITEISTGKVLLSRYEPGVATGIAFSRDGRQMVCGGGSAIHIYDFSRAVGFLSLVSEVEAAQNRLAARSGDVAALAVLANWFAFRQSWQWSLELFEQADYRVNELPAIPVARCRWQLGDFAASIVDHEWAMKRDELDAAYLELCTKSLRVATKNEKPNKPR